MDRYSFLSRPRLGMHSWILIVCLFSRHSCAAKKSLFFAFVREKKKKETEKRRRNLDLRHRFSSVEVPSLRVCCPSVVDRSARGKFPFCRNSEPLRISSLSTIKTTGPENKVNSSSPLPSSPPPPRFFPQLVLKRTTTTSRANVLQDYPSTALRR